MRSYHAIVMVDLVKKVELRDCVLATKFYGKVYDQHSTESVVSQSSHNSFCYPCSRNS